MAKTLVGIVASDKTDKTIVVSVQTRKTHPLYKKQYTVTKRFMAHDEKNEAKIGDRVSITETRPLSARKRYLLGTILEKAAISADKTVASITKEEQSSATEHPVKREKAAEAEVVAEKVKKPAPKKAKKQAEEEE